MKISICHPTKRDFGRGLCQSCYQKVLRTENIERFRERDRIRAKKDRDKHPEEWKKRARESYRRHAKERMIYQKVRAYGITREQYERMIADSNGKCAICKMTPKQLTVDHNHKTGKVRGILCHQCNNAIGLFHENLSVIKSALKYLIVYKKI